MNGMNFLVNSFLEGFKELNEQDHTLQDHIEAEKALDDLLGHHHDDSYYDDDILATN